ncbi:MAG: hypothetical protein ABIQ41_10715 [Gemmatimonadales bacterium]
MVRRASSVVRRGCFVIGALLGACGENDSGPTPTHTLQKISGDSQLVAVFTASAPLIVRVDDEGALPAPGVIVHFAVTVGTGTVTLADTTGADGLASAIYTAATDSGIRKVRAQITRGQLFFTLVATDGPLAHLRIAQGQDQGANAGSVLSSPLGAKLVDDFGNGVAGIKVGWTIMSGGGTLGADTTVTDGSGVARVSRTLGPGAGGQFVRAMAVGFSDTLLFHSTAKKAMTVLAGGNNVPNKCTSDLWIQGSYAYTGTWGNCNGVGARALHVWDVSSGVTLVDSVRPGLGTVSDNEVSADGTLLLATAEGGGAANGLYIYSLTDPAHPVLVDSQQVTTGLHTGTFADIGGQRYVFATKDPSPAAMLVFRIQPDSADKIVQVASVAQPESYGMHDQFVRDGLAFVNDWDAGLRIYDVGDGRAGGSPVAPALVSSIVTSNNGVNCSCVHNSWWYHDANGGKRYVFVGQEGPSNFTTASGDIHVVDVSNMSAPVEVAYYHLAGAGVHNFWMDETRGILYAAYYNGGVAALDVTGTLSGNLASREISRITPGGPGNTFVWGVMLANGYLWASDMFSGFWKLSVP